MLVSLVFETWGRYAWPIESKLHLSGIAGSAPANIQRLQGGFSRCPNGRGSWSSVGAKCSPCGLVAIYARKSADLCPALLPSSCAFGGAARVPYICRGCSGCRCAESPAAQLPLLMKEVDRDTKTSGTSDIEQTVHFDGYCTHWCML